MIIFTNIFMNIFMNNSNIALGLPTSIPTLRFCLFVSSLCAMKTWRAISSKMFGLKGVYTKQNPGALSFTIA